MNGIYKASIMRGQKATKPGEVDLLGHDELWKVHEGQGAPFKGPDSTPLRHFNDDKQYPQLSTELHSLQRPIATLKKKKGGR